MTEALAKYPKTPSFSLAGKRALVAGASSGIGLGCAIALAEHGAAVTLASRTAEKIEAAAAELTARGFQAGSIVVDVADVEATARVVGAEDPFHILVNSAGMARHSRAVDTTTQNFDAVMNLNLRGAYFLTQAVAKGLLAAREPGSLINISSQMGHVGGLDRAVYCASKFAVEGFTKAMALEFGPAGIRVNTICPTFIRTPMTEPIFAEPGKIDWVKSRIKLGRVGEIEDIMGAVVYLASDASSMVTGSAMMIDGGWTAD